MITGWIDAVTPGGFVEGWASNDEEPLKPVRIAVADYSGDVVAKGIANLYRDDLIEAGVGVGWSFFRVLDKSFKERPRSGYLLLSITSRTVLHAVDEPREIPDPEQPTDIGGVTLQDPTVLSSISELRGCRAVFSQYISDRGLEEFVRTGFVYVLNRPPDTPGLENYRTLLESLSISPLGFIYALFASDEFTSDPRPLAAPTTNGFPFKGF